MWFVAENTYFCTLKPCRATARNGAVRTLCAVVFNWKPPLLMITRDDFEQLKAFARIDGAVLGALWLLSFACFIGEFYAPVLGLAAVAVGIGSLVFAALRLRRFRDTVLDGRMSFRRGYAYWLLVFFYAALVMALGQFVYFQFLDHGFMAASYAEVMSSPEFKAMLQLYGVRDSEMQLLIDNLNALRPIDIALQFFTSNLILGAAIGLPMAVMMARRKGRKHINS